MQPAAALGPTHRSGGVRLHDEAQQDLLSEALARTVRDLRPASAWALAAAISALETDGVTGRLIIDIPRKVVDKVDVNFVTGVCDVVQRGLAG